MLQPAGIAVYLQAVGGHFLGTNAYNPANITVGLGYSGGSINMPYLATKYFTDDGNVSSNFTDGASSFMPIITVPQPGAAVQTAAVNFLSPDFTTIAARTTVTLNKDIEIGEITVSVPTTLGKPLLLKQSIVLNPMQPAYKVIIAVPGLYLLPAEVKGSIAVYVRMMCGCPVTAGPPASLWPANDFTVYANVLDVKGAATSYLLSYATNQTGNSLFSAALPANQPQIKSVTFTAVQKSTGNYGAVMWAP